MNDPVLSVLFITYNHEKYLRQSLESVLSQETDFDFEVVVGEDCSTDSTRDILREYKKAYPDKVRLLFRDRNFGRPTLNVYETAMECRGKYIATLEGDDYWIDTHKLQKAVDFLEAHPDYSGCANPALLIGEDGTELSDKTPLRLYTWDKEVYTLTDYRADDIWPGQTASIVTRNFWKDGLYDYTVIYRAHDFIDDAWILLFTLLHGPIHHFDEVMSSWRYVVKDEGENWNSLNQRRNQYMQETYFHVAQMYWLEQYRGLDKRERERAWYDFKLGTSIFVKHPSAESWRVFATVLKYDFLHVICCFPKPAMNEHTGEWKPSYVPRVLNDISESLAPDAAYPYSKAGNV
ncbi:MAG: glycosyltransferase [Lachnospiraceae bacterium]|nr:glycosyltransferase [Lachnospiraceae bacterium]